MRLEFVVHAPSFQDICHPLHEAPAQGTVHHAVVVTVAEEHHVAHPDHVPLRGLDHSRLLAYGTCGHDGHLRLVDDRCAEHVAEGPHVGDGIGPTRHLVRLEPALPGTVGGPGNRQPRR